MKANISRNSNDGIILFATLAALVLLSSLLITSQNIVVKQVNVVSRIFQNQDARNDLQSVRTMAIPDLMAQIASFENGEVAMLAPILVTFDDANFQVEVKDARARNKFSVIIVKK